MENKKGQINIGILVAIIIVFIAPLLLAVAWIFLSEITDALVNTKGFAGSVNISEAADDTLGRANRAANIGIPLTALFIMLAPILGMIIGGLLFKTEGYLIAFDFLLLIMAYIISVVFLNSYETLLQTPTLGEKLRLFTGFNFLMLNLNRVVLVLGVIGMVTSYVVHDLWRNSGGLQE